MGFRKPEKIKEGTKFLFYGRAGSGKTPTALSFPNIAFVDSDSGTNFYDRDNVLVMTNKLSFRELNQDLDGLELDDEIFDEVETFAIDSITRFYETMSHAMNKVAEKRAARNNRDKEAEVMSFREYGKMKTYYEEFFARMMGYSKQGKHLVFIAEQKDVNENVGGEIKKVGVAPTGPKYIDHDFDVVVRTYSDKNGNPKGIVEKDRTGTFKIGDEVDKPNYELWKEAVESALEGRSRSKEEIESLTESVKEEMLDLDDGETLKDKIKEETDRLRGEDKTEEAKNTLEKAMNTYKFMSVSDTALLRKGLEALKEIK